LPAGFNSTALTALEPMSRPTTDRLLLKKEKFFTVGPLPIGNPGTTRARGFDDENRRRLTTAITLL
jgi:hypothetical protein